MSQALTARERSSSAAAGSTTVESVGRHRSSTLDPPAERTLQVAPAAHDRRAPVITHDDRITGAVADRLWDVYRSNFEPLADLALLQHLFSRDEVLAELANPRIRKIVAWHGGNPVGLGMVTNHLDDVPQISPAFLRARYPDHAARDAIYYGILVMVAQEFRGRSLFSRIYTEMWQIPAQAGGVLAIDICEFNRQMFDTDALTQRIASQFPRGSVDVVDRQTWYIAELPEPIPAAPELR